MNTLFLLTSIAVICRFHQYIFNMSLCEVPNQSQSVSEVSPQKENWNIIARVIRSWFVPDFTKQRCPFSMEFVIQDKEVIIHVIL